MRVLRPLAGGLTPIILIAAVVALGAWALRASIVTRAEEQAEAEKASVATVTVQKGEFKVIVEAVGKLAAVNSKPVIAEVSGQIIAIATNGSHVEEGDVIIELDVPRMFREVQDQEQEYRQALEELEEKKRDLAADVEKAELALEKAQTELKQFQEQTALELAQKTTSKEKDEADLALARKRFERQKKLADEGLVPQQDVELATSEIRAKEFALEREIKDLQLTERQKESEELDKQAAVTRAEAELERAKSRRESELRNAQTALEVRKTQLDRVQDEFGKSIIKAPADGILVLSEEGRGGVQRRPLQPGDQVWDNRTVATIPDLSEMRVEFMLRQEQAHMVKKKHPAIVMVDAVAGMTFEAEVTEISQTATEARIPGIGIPSGERSFPARAEIEDLKDVALRPGTTANIDIIVNTIPDAVTVPLACVFERDERSIVWVRRGRDFRPVEVVLGEKSKGAVLITKGLEGGEEVALRNVGDEAPTADEPAGEAAPAPVLSQGAAE